MRDIEVGQVLAFKIRFNNKGECADYSHPYLVIEANEVENYVEIAQLDHIDMTRLYIVMMECNEIIDCTGPNETVIDEDSYIQLNNTIKVEYFENLSDYRRQKDKLSENKLKYILARYKEYHENHEIDDMKIVYMTEKEILQLNK